MDPLIERCCKGDQSFTQEELFELIDKYRWHTATYEEISPTLIEETVVIKYGYSYFAIDVSIYDGEVTLYQPVRRYYGKPVS